VDTWAIVQLMHEDSPKLEKSSYGMNASLQATAPLASVNNIN